MRRDSIVMRDYVIIGVCVAALAGLSWGAWMLRRPHELAPREAPQATVDAPRRDTLAAEAERARREARPLPQVAFDLAKLRSPAGQAPQARPRGAGGVPIREIRASSVAGHDGRAAAFDPVTPTGAPSGNQNP